MLPHYSPLKVAETFSMLSGLFPGRIDLGLGRAPGTDPQTTLALQRDRRQPAPDDFPEQLAELLAYLEDRFPPGPSPSPGSPALPGRPERPEVWLLGSSPQSAIWAAELGLPYAFADFINPGRRGDRRGLPRGCSPRPSGSRLPASRSPSGSSAPRPTRRRSASRRASAWRSRCCAVDSRSRCPRSRRRSASSRATDALDYARTAAGA